MEKQELDELVSKMDGLVNKIKVENSNDPSVLAEYLVCFGKLYNVPEAPISVYTDFLTIVEMHPDIIYDDGPVNVSFAIGSLNNICKLADEQTKKDFLFGYVENHLLCNAVSEGIAKQMKRLEDTNWLKFAVKCEAQARKLGWSGRYADADSYKKDLDESKFASSYNLILDTMNSFEVQQCINFSFNVLISEIKKFVEARPDIKCKDALLAIYSFSDADDAYRYESYVDKCGDVENVIKLIIQDFTQNDFYGTSDAFLIYLLISYIGEDLVESDINYSMTYFLLEKAFELELNGYEPVMGVDLGAAGYIHLCDFMYWYKRMYIGKNDAGEPLKYRSGCEDDILAESNDSSAAGTAPKSSSTSASQVSNNSQYEQEEVGCDLKNSIIWVAIPVIIIAIGVMTLFYGIGLVFILIAAGLVSYFGKHKYAELMFHEEVVIVDRANSKEAAAFIRQKFTAKHFREIDGDDTYNFHKGISENPIYGVNVYKIKDDPNHVKISIFVSNLTSKGGLPKGFFSALKLKDSFALELKEKFGV